MIGARVMIFMSEARTGFGLVIRTQRRYILVVNHHFLVALHKRYENGHFGITRFLTFSPKHVFQGSDLERDHGK